MKSKTKTYQVQARLGDKFEDLYIKAKNEKQALAKARKLTTIKSRFVNFVI